MEIISGIFDFFKYTVHLWKVILVGLPIALAVQFLFNGRKAWIRGFLPPILWVVLTVTVLIFLSNEGGFGGGQGGDGPTQEGPQEPGTPKDNPKDKQVGSTTQVSSKPISLIIRRNDDGTFTFEDETKQYYKGVDKNDLDSKLESMKGSGYNIVHIDTYGLPHDTPLKDKKYPPVTTH